MDALPRLERDTVVVHAELGDHKVIKLPPRLELTELLLALKDVLSRAELFEHHAVRREALSVRQRMGELLSRLEAVAFQRFDSLFDTSEGRIGIVVTFLAMLELAKEMLVEIVQEAPHAPIYLRAKVGHTDEPADADRRDAPELEPSPFAAAAIP